MSYRNYAKALLELAIERNQLDDVFNDFEDFMQVIHRNKAWLDMAYFEGVKDLDDLHIDNEITQTFHDFIKLVIKDKQILNIKKIYDHFRELENIYENEVYFKVYAKKELTEDQISKINAYLVEAYPHKKVILKTKIDKNMIGGIRVLYKGLSLDLSLTNRLKSLFNQI